MWWRDPVHLPGQHCGQAARGSRVGAILPHPQPPSGSRDRRLCCVSHCRVGVAPQGPPVPQVHPAAQQGCFQQLSVCIGGQAPAPRLPAAPWTASAPLPGGLQGGSTGSPHPSSMAWGHVPGQTLRSTRSPVCPHHPQGQSTPTGASIHRLLLLLLPSTAAVLTHHCLEKSSAARDARRSPHGAGLGPARLSPVWFVGFWKPLKCRRPGAGGHGCTNQLCGSQGGAGPVAASSPHPRFTPQGPTWSPVANTLRDMGMVLPPAQPTSMGSTLPQYGPQHSTGAQPTPWLRVPINPCCPCKVWEDFAIRRDKFIPVPWASPCVGTLSLLRPFRLL